MVIMPTANELGLIEGGKFPPKIKAGDTLEVNGIPKFETAEKLGGATVAIIPTLNGEVATTSKTIIGQLKSDNEKSAGGLILRAVELGKSLTLYVVERDANTGRKQLALTPFAP